MPFERSGTYGDEHMISREEQRERKVLLGEDPLVEQDEATA